MFTEDQINVIKNIKIDYYDNRAKAIIFDKKTGKELAYFKFVIGQGWLEKDASLDQTNDWFIAGYENFGEWPLVVMDWVTDYAQYQKEEGEN